MCRQERCSLQNESNSELKRMSEGMPQTSAFYDRYAFFGRERWLSRSGGLPPLFGALFSPFCGKANEIRKIFVGRENQLREIVYRETVNTEYGFGKGFTD